jgi:hypothetical protein
MKKRFICLLSALALLLVLSSVGRADQFSQIQNSPATYWVPAPTPRYAGAPGPAYPAYYGYYGPPPGYYYAAPPPPPAPPVVIVPHFFFGIHVH